MFYTISRGPEYNIILNLVILIFTGLVYTIMHKSTDWHDCVGGALVLMRVDYLIFGAYYMEINTFILSDVSSEGIYAVSSCLKTSCCLQNLSLNQSAATWL